MFTELILVALGVFAAWDLIRIYMREWFWQWVPPLIVAALAYGDFEAPHIVQLVGAAVGLAGMLTVLKHRVEREEIVIDRRHR